jgi:hypothetical protein
MLSAFSCEKEECRAFWQILRPACLPKNFPPFFPSRRSRLFRGGKPLLDIQPRYLPTTFFKAPFRYDRTFFCYLFKHSSFLRTSQKVEEAQGDQMSL